MDQTTFTHLVEQVVEHLYDHPYLQTHPLGRALVAEPAVGLRGHTLQRIILDAIQALRPAADSAQTSRAWRTYRYLFLRFVQALPPREVASELMVSERQARRVYREALDALASVLWDGYRPPPESNERQAPPAVTQTALIEENSLLDQEIHHFAAESHGSFADLPSVVEGLRPIVEPLARRHDCVWTVDLDPNVVGLAVDRVVVRQVLLNLFTTAFERRSHQVRLQASRIDEQIQLAIELLPNERSMDDDSQAATDPIADRIAVSSGLVKAAGGSVDLRASRAGGLVVSVRLPGAKRPVVLVVDDNPDVVAVIERYLEVAGCAVLKAHGGHEALQLARDAQPTAITLDVMMASVDGWETLQLLKNDPATRDIPVVICSVLREDELARFLGAAEVLPKPVDRTALYQALARCGLTVRPAARQNSL
jgi:CheY-like chemotaxis protein